MKTAFLICALALPPVTKDREFRDLKLFLERHYPGYEVVLIHPDETLLTPWSLPTPLHFRGLRVHLVRSA
jgi:hypothetical protein